MRSILQSIKRSANSAYNVFSKNEIKHLTRLCFALHHLRAHSFDRSFRDSFRPIKNVRELILDPISSGELNIKSTCNYYIYCANFVNGKTIHLDILSNSKINIMYHCGIPSLYYLLKVKNINIRTSCEICSKLTIKTPELRSWRRFSVFIVNFEHISNLVLVFLLLTLSM